MDIQIQTTLPTIRGNFEEIEQQLEQGLKQYSVQVTDENLKEAKSMAAELNKLKGAIDKARKEKKSELSAPIVEFEDRMKNLTSRCNEARGQIVSQVEKFEQAKKDACLKLLKEHRNEIYEEMSLRDEFRDVEVADLALLSNLTPKGALTKRAQDSVWDRVKARYDLQNEVDRRLETLELYSLRAGLKSPLQKTHVEHFLMADSETYNKKLNELIEVEKKRESDREAKYEAQKQKEIEAARKAEQEKAKVQEPQYAPRQELKAQEPILPKVTKSHSSNGKVKFIVTATFEVEFDESREHELSGMLVKKFANAGFKTVPEVSVQKKEQEQASRLEEGSLF